MNKLKPYPFCGSEESEWIEHSPDCYLYKIVRQVESGCTAYCKESCEESWNTRFTENKQAELEKENEKLTGQLNTATDKLLEYEALLRAIRNNYLSEPSITWYKMQVVKKFIDEALDKKGGE